MIINPSLILDPTVHGSYSTAQLRVYDGNCLINIYLLPVFDVSQRDNGSEDLERLLGDIEPLFKSISKRV